MTTGVKPTPSRSTRNIEREARLAGDGIEADAGEKHAEQRHQHRFVHRSVRQVNQRGQTEQHERGIFRRAEVKTKFRQRRRQKCHAEERDRAADKGAKGGDAERRTGATLARHRVAVETGDDRRSFAGNIDQDRRRRAAVLRAVGNAEQHDQISQRRRVQRQRQKQRDGAGRTETGKHADQGAQQDAGETIQ